jgi:hypothetical protein
MPAAVFVKLLGAAVLDLKHLWIELSVYDQNKPKNYNR